MAEERNTLIKSFLSNLHVSVDTAAFTKCPLSWRDMDYKPDYNKFYYIMDGKGWLEIDGMEYYPRSGQLFLMPAGIKQSYSVIDGEPFTKYWCHFGATIGEVNLFDIINVPYFINITDRAMVEDIFKRLAAFHNSGSLASSLNARGVLYALVAYYLEEASKQYLLLKDSESVEKVLELVKYIDANISTNITISALAERVHYHPNYFIRFFNKHFGISPARYILNKKIEKAKILLSACNTSISEVACQTGFSDVCHFSKVFKSYTGFSPSEYRKIVM